MTPAERLRAAATRLREVAGDATPGPWVAGVRCVWGLHSDDEIVVDGDDGDGGVLREADADYIAMMHPPVALALADWLDSEAAVQGSMEPMANLISLTIEKAGGPAGYVRIGTDEDGNPQMQADSSPAALAVADAVLGGEQR